jgi:hypothetical protein
MPSRPSLESGSPQTSARSDGLVTPNIQELKSLAVRGLGSMFDAEKQLFCNRLVRMEQGLVREGLSPRYTIMTLLGLRELERVGGHSPFDTQGLYETFIRDTKWIQCAGDLGLLIWLVASFNPDHIEDFIRRSEIETAPQRYADARHGRTTELSWFLAGLSHAALSSPRFASNLTDLALKTYQLVKKNQGKHGFFGHMAKVNSVAGLLRGRIGSFADQIYPIYAMSKFTTAFNVEESLDSALKCAVAICHAQGPMGQWWWLYDSNTGRTSSRYPVYSVHQHGMAPMGLFALEEATGQVFTNSIYKGLQWIYGANELAVDMRDFTQNLIWRCILPKWEGAKYLDTMLSVLRSPKQDAPPGPLEILYEDRPYEFGWMLYAFAKIGAAS